VTLQLHDSWELLICIVSEDGGDNPFGGAHERLFVRDYILNTAVDGQEAGRIRKRVEKGSRRFLEKQYVMNLRRLLGLEADQSN